MADPKPNEQPLDEPKQPAADASRALVEEAKRLHESFLAAPPPPDKPKLGRW